MVRSKLLATGGTVAARADVAISLKRVTSLCLRRLLWSSLFWWKWELQPSRGGLLEVAEPQSSS